MFKFFKFLKLAIAVISVVLSVVQAFKQATETHFNEAAQA